MHRILRTVLAGSLTAAALAFSLFLPTPAAADSEPAPVAPSAVADQPTVTDREGNIVKENLNQPSATGFGGLLSQGDAPENSPTVDAKGGGPTRGVGSASTARSLDLPSQIESLWPTPGVELHFPNREVRVTFTEEVDSRTFTGQVVGSDGKVVSGTDGAPVLFTRAPETPSKTREVIGTLAALAPGTYEFQWSVKTVAGKTISYSSPFTQLEAVTGVGGSNHRHSDLRLPGEDYVMAVARFLLIIAFSFALLFATTRRWARAATSAALAAAGSLYTIAFALPAYDSDQSLAELLANLEGWAALAVVVTAVAAGLSRNRVELVGYASVALLAAQATSYTPRLANGLVHVALLAVALAAVGSLLAAASGGVTYSTGRKVLIALGGVSAPAISLVIAAGTIFPDRGQGEDLRLRLLAGVVALVLFGVSLLFSEGLKVRNPRVHIPLVLIAGVALSWVTAAPALL